MFQIVSNIFNRSIITSVSLEEFIDMMKNPNFLSKKQVDLARESYKNSILKKDDPLYKSIKNSLPCITFLNTFNNYVSNENIVNTTGFMYLDVDNISHIDLSKHNFVVAYWKSLSENGYGILIKCDETGVLQDNIKELSDLLGIELDKNAVSKDRLNIIGYDYNIYFNPNYTSFNFSKKEMVSQGNIKRLEYRLRASDTHNVSETIRFSNFKDLLKDYDFNGETFIDLGDNKLEYAEVFVPKNIFEGNRNKSMFVLCSQVRGLNPWINESLLFKVCDTINKDKFRPMISYQELSSIVNKVYKKLVPVVMLNKTRRILFNPDYNLSKIERLHISAKQIRKTISDKNTLKIITSLYSWDFDKLGKITKTKIAINTGLGIATVKRRTKEINDFCELLEQDTCTV